jgi:hypothetical protein
MGHCDRPTPEPADRGGFGLCRRPWLDDHQKQGRFGPRLGRDPLPRRLPAGVGLLDPSGTGGPCQSIAAGSGPLPSQSGTGRQWLSTTSS